jgi:predicted dinucleotide-binding enzyme
MAKLKVGILGTGQVGRTMGTGCIDLGYGVMLGSRNNDSHRASEWAQGAGEEASTGTFQEAAAYGNVIILAVRGAGAEDAIRAAGVENFSGKIVIDVTNPLDFPENEPPTLFTAGSESLGERIQTLLPDSRVVKAFNCVGANLFVKPHFGAERPDMFLAGNDVDAKRVISGLCEKWGWRPIDVGGVDAARALEPLVLLWMRYGSVTGKWTHAFKLLTP